MISTDQLGNRIVFKQTPQRVISLVPSQSEYLWDLGLNDRLVGITKFCVHPRVMYRKVKRVGGTKNLNISAIRALKPDLIIGNKEENDKTQIELLAKEFPVWMSDILTFNDAFEMMQSLASVLDRKLVGRDIVKKSRLAVKKSENIFLRKKVVYFIWKDPYLCAGKETFIHEVLGQCGLKNVLASKVRYPEISLAELKKLKPYYCFLSSEPFPFQQKHISEIQAALPDTKIVLVDGEMFSWYGSRLVHLFDYLQLLKKEL